MSKSFHGTHVAGIIIDNTTSNVKIKSYNYFYYSNNSYVATTSTMVNEINTAVNDGMDVINLSLSGTVEGGRNKSVEEAVNNAVNKNVVVVASAGNYNRNAAEYYPANVESAITVAATNSNNRIWSGTNAGSGSNYGSCVDIAAPGKDIYSTLPNNKYGNQTGTSMSAPFVSAAAALLKSVNKGLSPDIICAAMTNNATVPGGWNSSYGVGIVNYKNMLKSISFTAPKISLGTNDKITIYSDAKSGNNINVKYYYTTDGTNPTKNSKLYNGAFSVPTGTKEIKAITCIDNVFVSKIATYPITVTDQIELRYRGSQKIELPENARNVQYISSDESIVEIRNGSVYGKSVGDTIVTVKMNANRIYTYYVHVKYEWWQQLIMIFLLGFLWY